MAAVALKSSKDRALKLTEVMLPFLYREMMGKSSTDTHALKTLAIEVSELLKETIGNEKYSSLLIRCSKAAAETKQKRKREQAVLAVNDPEAAYALKKAKRGKLSAKKRKNDARNPYRVIKRKKEAEFRTEIANENTEFFD